jgi:hypothetical protein
MPDPAAKRRSSARFLGSVASSSAATPASISNFSHEGNSDTPLTSMSDLEDIPAWRSPKKQPSRRRKNPFKPSEDSPLDSDTSGSDLESDYESEFEPESVKSKGKGKARVVESDYESEFEPEPVKSKGKGKARVFDPEPEIAERENKRKGKDPISFSGLQYDSDSSDDILELFGLNSHKHRSPWEYAQPQSKNEKRKEKAAARKEARMAARAAFMENADPEDYYYQSDHSSSEGFTEEDDEFFTGTEIDYDVEDDRQVFSRRQVAGVWQITRRSGWGRVSSWLP